ncbi:MAG: acyl-ACP--UDP-N-acetylglucosamine O-acyltransferase [Bacteroidia bacterium]|nr:acyl-ACP--UDP-N-acetylglucosamine O-acyltransferase [Bacteroidia bacterium]
MPASLSRISLGDHVHLEPGAVLHGGITIGSHCWIGSAVTIYDGARIGESCKIFPGAVISAIPQDLKFSGEKTTLEIGDHTIVRECATLNRGTVYHGKTSIGSRCLIMAYVHVAHDCVIGDYSIIANAVNMAGHVEIGPNAVIGGATAIHQFVKIGKQAMISGGSLVRKDVPPFVKAGREPLRYVGVNSIGLRRRGMDNQSIHAIQDIYRYIYLSGMNISAALTHVEAHLPATEDRDEIITFIRKATRGIIRGYTPDANGGDLGDGDHDD